MTFELLLKPLQAEKKPYLAIFLSFIITTIAILLGYKIFPDSASVLIITFCIIPLVPIMVKLIELEEDRFARSKRWYSVKNYRIIQVYAYLFLGFLISFAFYYTILPADKTDVIFKEQIDTLYDHEPISSRAVEEFSTNEYCDTVALSKYLDDYEFRNCKVYDYHRDGSPEFLIWVEGDESASLVYLPDKDEFVEYKNYVRGYFFLTNLQVLGFIFLTSFIFGSGALFVIIWNASIIGVFIGEAALRFANLFAISRVEAFFTTLPIALGGLLLHGIPEVLGFFVAAIAGGILSTGMLRHKPMSKRFIRIVIDSVILFVVAIVLIGVAAVLEAL